MKFIDSKFKTDKLHYLLQCSLAGVAMALILAILTPLTNTGVIAALGASTFIVFALPHAKASAWRYLLGGYLVALAVGTSFLWLRWIVPLPQHVWIIPDLPKILFGGMAVAMTMFLMVITDTEHPPAAALALGIAMLETWHPFVPAAIIIGIVALCLVRTLFSRWLKDLL